MRVIRSGGVRLGRWERAHWQRATLCHWEQLASQISWERQDAQLHTQAFHHHITNFTLRITKPGELRRAMGQLTGKRLPCLSLVLVKVASLQLSLQAAWIRLLRLDATPASTFTSPLSDALRFIWNHEAAWGTQIIPRSDTQTSITNAIPQINQKTRRFLSVSSFSTSLLLLFGALIGRHVYCLPLAAGLRASSLEWCSTFLRKHLNRKRKLCFIRWAAFVFKVLQPF